MSTPDDFRHWWDALHIPFISADEALVKTARAPNTLPPRHLWQNMVRTAWIVSLLRQQLGVPVTLHSTYRNEAYNRMIGGVSTSQHLVYNAIDFSFNGMESVDVYNELRSWRERGVFSGGIGLYPSFIHLDCFLRGYNATWES